jgi:hypothetical protein
LIKSMKISVYIYSFFMDIFIIFRWDKMLVRWNWHESKGYDFHRLLAMKTNWIH